MTKTVRARLQYMVGGLLYSPAINVGLAEKIDNGCFPCLTSMAFCLEDSIRATYIYPHPYTRAHGTCSHSVEPVL